MDLKIELRNLAALHEASMQLEHGIRDARSASAAWRAFAPSKFVYAFFTFNSIYSFDWSSSFSTKRPVFWSADDQQRCPAEEEQIKSYVMAIDKKLSSETAELFRNTFTRLLSEFRIEDPVGVVKAIPLTNATTKLKKLAGPLAPYTKKLFEGTVDSKDMYCTLSHLLKFIYLVRCNVFHGAKTHVEMTKPDQQQRLLVYCAIVVAANALLFEAAKRADIGWQELTVDLR